MPSDILSPSGGSLNWITYPLANGWRGYFTANADANYPDAQYAVSSGFVFLRGALDAVNATGDFAALPAEARPAGSRHVLVNTLSGATGCYMNSAGVLKLVNGSALTGLSFAVFGMGFAL